MPSSWEIQFRDQDIKPEKLSDAVVAFAPVGVIIGFMTGLVWLIGSQLLPASIAATLAIASGILITGALHEDGLADFADGFGGTSSREQTLKIMRDSQIGTYGAIAVLFSILVRILVLAAMPLWMGFFALIITHSSARAAIALALNLSYYVRHEGAGDTVKQGISQRELLITLGTAIVIGLIVSLSFGFFGGLFAILFGLCGAWLVLEYSEKRLSGYTGDVLGTMEQTTEITIMIALAAFWL